MIITENNICPECGTENEKEYIYCKNCGKALKEMPKSGQNTQYVPNQSGFQQENPNFSHPVNNNYGYTQNVHNAGSPYNQGNPNYSGNPNFSASQGFNQNNGGYAQNTANQSFTSNLGADQIDGIPMNEIVLYVGKKANEICPKFSKMQITGSKTSWCWPAAVLGFIFGPLGSAIWFFYRKMYKAALILLAIGVAVTVAVSALSYGRTSELTSSILDSFPQVQSFSDLINNIDDINSKLTHIDILKYTIATSIASLSRLATCILTGLFGYYLYKNSSVEKIKNYRNVCTDQRYYSFGLASIGGTSGGMLAVGIVCLIMVNNLAAIIMSMV